MRETSYRGYSIRYRNTGVRWSAHIRRPGGFMVMKDGFLAASLEEGEAVLLQRARAKIDAEEDAALPSRRNPGGVREDS